MNNQILLPNVQEFIRKNLTADPAHLALQKSPFKHVTMREIVVQVVGMAKAQKKIPEWFFNNAIYYPEKTAIEQSSSEITARYKAALVSGDRLIDLTGGFGVDAYYFSKNIGTVIHCEQQATLSEIASHNFKALNAFNIKCLADCSAVILDREKKKFDWIYVDPSRRTQENERVFKLADCEPNVSANLNLYLKKAKNILLKTSPLLDIAAGLNDLSQVKAVHLVAVHNDLKELLWHIEADYSGPVKIHTVNFNERSKEYFSFNWDSSPAVQLSAPKKYLYEPNVAIMKSGGFYALTVKYQILPLHNNTHLFTSNNLIEFPGRRFDILTVMHYGKKSIKELAALGKANIATRNFPESVEMLRKQTKLKDGGNDYLFFTTGPDGKKIVLLCKKII